MIVSCAAAGCGAAFTIVDRFFMPGTMSAISQLGRAAGAV